MDGRNDKGQFIKGHKPLTTGPISTHGKKTGRRKRSTEEKYLKWMAARVKKADWDTITDTAIARAKSGDNVARQWLSDYLIGKPQQQLDITSAGERLPSVIVYLPEIDGLETEPGTTGEVSS